ncbi:hypothetical protein M011DRAFT_216970 [Sporormia fimetaria CBS 119925]|uniref:Uncharacterized protein n=1 Tax=Sporormia fimetaria CBS 119925 TaxID=1340428 RepID=A0A6A6V0Y4_9PLEO|nr:hypothetical protein M011DRAFT_216970 [Sporormia fimetaria CBS 119925]
MRFVWKNADLKSHPDEMRWQAVHVHNLVATFNLPEPRAIADVRKLHHTASVRFSLDDGASILSTTEFAMDDEIVNSVAYRRALVVLHKKTEALHRKTERQSISGRPGQAKPAYLDETVGCFQSYDKPEQQPLKGVGAHGGSDYNLTTTCVVKPPRANTSKDQSSERDIEATKDSGQRDGLSDVIYAEPGLRTAVYFLFTSFTEGCVVGFLDWWRLCCRIFGEPSKKSPGPP